MALESLKDQFANGSFGDPLEPWLELPDGLSHRNPSPTRSHAVGSGTGLPHSGHALPGFVSMETPTLQQRMLHGICIVTLVCSPAVRESQSRSCSAQYARTHCSAVMTLNNTDRSNGRGSCSGTTFGPGGSGSGGQQREQTACEPQGVPSAHTKLNSTVHDG